MTTTERSTPEIATAPNGHSTTYPYDYFQCEYRLPCGHCRLLGYKCPYYGGITFTFNKVMC